MLIRKTKTSRRLNKSFGQKNKSLSSHSVHNRPPERNCDKGELYITERVDRHFSIQEQLFGTKKLRSSLSQKNILQVKNSLNRKNPF